MYKILFGIPVFNCHTTAELIMLQKREISFPIGIQVSEDAKSLIRSMLTYNWHDRISFEELREHQFLTSIYQKLEPIHEQIPYPHDPSDEEYEILTDRLNDEEQNKKDKSEGCEQINNAGFEKPMNSDLNAKIADSKFSASEIDEIMELYIAYLDKQNIPMALIIIKYCREKYEYLFSQVETISQDHKLTRETGSQFVELYESLRRKLKDAIEKTIFLEPFSPNLDPIAMARELQDKALRLSEFVVAPQLKHAWSLLKIAVHNDSDNIELVHLYQLIHEMYLKSA